jgi:hypothetical protein
LANLDKVKIFLDPHTNGCVNSANFSNIEDILIHEENHEYDGAIIEIKSTAKDPPDYF